MKRKLSSLISLLWILPLLAGCISSSTPIEADLGQEFLLPIGQEARITGENLQISFEDVIGDSRCPIGITCIWEGQVTCLIEITYAYSQNRMTLTKQGSGQDRADFNEYDIEFEVQPYPEAGKQIAKQDYRLQLVINKKPALSEGILCDSSAHGVPR